MTIRSYAPVDGSVHAEIDETSTLELDEVVARATRVSSAIAGASPVQRSRWLSAIAIEIEAHRDELVALADSETALGRDRLDGELSRTADQWRFYGSVAAEGSYLGAAIDSASARSPRLVRANIPLGPVAVFGASNFPFAFGVLGNDTASALAAGCPVVVKAHSAHPLTSALLVNHARRALEDAGAEVDLISVVAGRSAGAALVARPEIKAVGFTGSQDGGLTLWRIANERAEVIPVYAEMGTVNPVVVTPGGARRSDEIARGFVGSFTLGAGQFCTKPGMLFAPVGSGITASVAAALRAAAPRPVMLTSAIADGVRQGIEALVAGGATLLERVPGHAHGWSADAAVLSARAGALTPGSRLLEECFGAVALIVEYSDTDELESALRVLHGSLAGAVFGGVDDPDVARFVDVLARQVGRVTVGDWTTGVATNWAQQHGGPWPATSAPAATSVGAAALSRFVRPVTFQSVPESALPTAIRLAVDPLNPWAIPRRVDGALVPV